MEPRRSQTTQSTSVIHCIPIIRHGSIIQVNYEVNLSGFPNITHVISLTPGHNIQSLFSIQDCLLKIYFFLFFLVAFSVEFLFSFFFFAFLIAFLVELLFSFLFSCSLNRFLGRVLVFFYKFPPQRSRRRIILMYSAITDLHFTIQPLKLDLIILLVKQGQVAGKGIRLILKFFLASKPTLQTTLSADQSARRTF